MMDGRGEENEAVRRRCAAFRRVALACAVILGMCGGTLFRIAPAAAQTRTVIRTGGGSGVQTAMGQPPGGVSAGDGLAVTVSTNWPENPGYRPVTVVVSHLAGVTPRTRDLRLELSVGEDVERGEVIVSEERVTLPASSTGVQVEFLLPQYVAWHALRLRLYDGGRRLRDAEVEYSPWVGNWHQPFPVVLIAGGTLPNTTNLAMATDVPTYTAAQGNGTWIGGQWVPTPTNANAQVVLPSAFALPLAEFPDEWLRYTCMDVVILSQVELDSLATQRPAAAEALLHWNAAGGNLWVYGVGDQWEGLAALEERLGVSTLSDDASSALGGTMRGWDQPPNGKYGRLTADLVTENYYGVATETADGTKRSKPSDAPKEKPFIWRDRGLGRVVAMRADDPWAADQKIWAWLSRTAGGGRLQWEVREGVSLRGDNVDFWDFLIPGVGLVPVIAFLVLITIFVVIIGPVNAIALVRARRRQWSMLTIPACAVLFTLGLFSYAFLKDGLSTRVRARSYTEIDQRRGEAVSCARLSYYAGLSPGSDFRFPRDVAVYPLEPWRMQGYGSDYRLSEKYIGWGESQWLYSGWLPARTPTQYVTNRARASTLRLNVAVQPGAEGTLRVENELDAEVTYLLVRHANGLFYAGEAIADGAAVDLQEIDGLDATVRLGEIAEVSKPEVPEGVDPTQANMGRQRGWYGYSSGISGNLRASPMERSIREALGQGTKVDGIGPREYVAIVERSPEIAYGVSSFDEEASLHVIRGRW